MYLFCDENTFVVIIFSCFLSMGYPGLFQHIFRSVLWPFSFFSFSEPSYSLSHLHSLGSIAGSTLPVASNCTQSVKTHYELLNILLPSTLLHSGFLQWSHTASVILRRHWQGVSCPFRTSFHSSLPRSNLKNTVYCLCKSSYNRYMFF